jgi:uncharacterized RDD family membrane protein YckC
MENLFLKRSLAYIIDIIAISALSALVMLVQIFVYNKFAQTFSLSPWLERNENSRKLYFHFTTFVVFTAYMWLAPWLSSGLTLGKLICKIKIHFPQSPSGKDFFMRSLAYQISYILFGIGFLLPWFRRDNKTLHDIICKSFVLPIKNNLSTTAEKAKIAA